jgi:lysophospholipase L1-like esterase
MSRRRIALGIGLLILVGLLIVSRSNQKQANIPATLAAPTALYAGAGIDYGERGVLEAGTPIIIRQRSHTGNWLFIELADSDRDGWIMTSSIAADAGFRLSDVPIGESDADNVKLTDSNLRRLYAPPVIPEISGDMRAVFQRGQSLGNHANVVVKVGDSNSANRLYLSPISAGDYNLGVYDFLQKTVDFFGASFGAPDLATRVGATSQMILDPIFTDAAQCQPDESLLQCEYRLRQPAVAVIMFGQNDIRSLSSTEFDQAIRQIVEETIRQGIVPVLATFTSNPIDAENWEKALRYNLIIVDIADDFDAPLINIWSAFRDLPDFGLLDDNTHLTWSGEPVVFDGHEARYGMTLVNLLVLTTLDELRRDLHMD